jgi:hypothetical protein
MDESSLFIPIRAITKPSFTSVSAQVETSVHVPTIGIVTKTVVPVSATLSVPVTAPR